MNLDPYYQRQNVGQWFYFLEIYDVCGYSLGFLGDWASNDSGVVDDDICAWLIRWLLLWNFWR